MSAKHEACARDICANGERDDYDDILGALLRHFPEPDVAGRMSHEDFNLCVIHEAFRRVTDEARRARASEAALLAQQSADAALGANVRRLLSHRRPTNILLVNIGEHFIAVTDYQYVKSEKSFMSEVLDEAVAKAAQEVEG